MSGNPTIDVRQGEELQQDNLLQYLREVLSSNASAISIKQFPSGNSNLTYLIEASDFSVVLRRPPYGTIPKSGHDMAREYNVMRALRPAFPAVPETIVYEPDTSILGAPFYVMERVEGDLVHHNFPKDWAFTESDTNKFCYAFWDKLIELHEVDYKAVGLEAFGKPEGYVSRQILGWNKRFVKAQTPDVDGFEDVRNWLEENIPSESGRVSILHGDYRVDNLILDSKNHFNIKAVLDWEISALGDPIMDLGNSLAYWIEAEDPPHLQMIARQPSRDKGMLKRREIFEYYCDKRGISSENYTFYLAYGLFRLAVILQQIYYRYYHGESKNEIFSQFGKSVNMIGNHCRDMIEKA